MNRTFCLQILGVSLVVAASGGAAERQAEGEAQDYRELVQGLDSPNKPPNCEIGGPHVEFPPSYDEHAQTRIEKNRRILYEHCEEALPFLIEACTDSRYSLTWRSDSYSVNECVGEVCLEIVAAHLEVYREHMRLRTKEEHTGYRFVPRLNGAIGKQVTEEKKKEVEEWWRSRKGKSLLELQIEAFDWAIEKRRGRASDTKEIDEVVAARDKLKKDRKCLPPSRLAPAVHGSKQ